MLNTTKSEKKKKRNPRLKKVTLAFCFQQAILGKKQTTSNLGKTGWKETKEW
jgi:hypothetical protein